jgi:hypothetical protein
MTVLLREAIGDRLRHARTNQSRTLREISRAARVSLGYLSEVERGQKEASSELLAAICDALELPLSELLHHVATDVSALGSVDIDGVDIDGVGIDGVGMNRVDMNLAGSGSPDLAGGDGAIVESPGEHAAEARGSGRRPHDHETMPDLNVSAGGTSPSLRTTISGPKVASIIAA